MFGLSSVDFHEGAVVTGQRIEVESDIGKAYAMYPIIKHLYAMKVQQSPVFIYI